MKEATSRSKIESCVYRCDRVEKKLAMNVDFDWHKVPTFEKYDSSSYPIGVAMSLSSLVGRRVSRLLTFFPLFLLSQRVLVPCTQRHNLSLARKRLTKIWSSSLSLSSRTREFQPPRKHTNACPFPSFFTLPAITRSITSRSTYISSCLNTRDTRDTTSAISLFLSNIISPSHLVVSNCR